MKDNFIWAYATVGFIWATALACVIFFKPAAAHDCFVFDGTKVCMETHVEMPVVLPCVEERKAVRMGGGKPAVVRYVRCLERELQDRMHAGT